MAHIDHFFSQGDLKAQKYEVLLIILVSVPGLSFYPVFFYTHQNLNLFLGLYGHIILQSNRIIERIL